MIRPLQLIFTADDSASDMQYPSDAPVDLIPYDYIERPNWIKVIGIHPIG